MSYGQILNKYGPDGITRYALNAKGEAEISDDTQMALFTANGVPYPKTEYTRFAIPDCGVPQGTENIARLVERIIRNGTSCSDYNNKTYIHCWGGIGRTGTIVACLYAYLLKGKGLSADKIYCQAMQQLQDSFSRCHKSKYRTSPENTLQREFVRQFIINECV